MILLSHQVIIIAMSPKDKDQLTKDLERLEEQFLNALGVISAAHELLWKVLEKQETKPLKKGEKVIVVNFGKNRQGEGKNERPKRTDKKSCNKERP